MGGWRGAWLVVVGVLVSLVLAGCWGLSEDCGGRDSVEARDECWQAEAVGQGDVSICDEKIEGDNSVCRARVALAVDDKALCDLADDSVECLRLWGLQRMGEDIVACSGQDHKDECLAGVGIVAGGDTKPCFSADSRDFCLGVIAGGVGDARVCVSASNRQVCESAMGGAAEQVASGQCMWDYQCPSSCDGVFVQKYACNGRTDACDATFRDDCSVRVDVVAGYEIARTCVKGECRLSRDNVVRKQAELSGEVKQLLAARQYLTEMQLRASRECLSGLEDVTNEGIINTAEIIGGLSRKLPSVLGELVSQAFVDELALTDAEVTPAEYVARNCKLEKSLDGDLDELEQRIEGLQEDTRELDGVLILDYFR